MTFNQNNYAIECQRHAAHFAFHANRERLTGDVIEETAPNTEYQNYEHATYNQARAKCYYQRARNVLGLHD